jgi:heptosyltransferase-2
MSASPTLVIQTAFLGDVVLTIPLLQALAERHGPVDVITTPGAASLIETHPSVRRVIRYDKRKGSGVQSAWRLGRELAAEGYQRVYLPHRSVRSALIGKLTGAKERIGFADAPLLSRFLYTGTEPRDTTKHESERLIGLLGKTEAPKVRLDYGMTLTDADRSKADAWLAEAGVTGRFVALAPGSVWGTKRWPYYAELAAALVGPDKPIWGGVQVVVIGGPEDLALGDAIVMATGGKARNAVGMLSLRESAALLRKADVLVTNDSAPLHLATAVGTPIIAIFGPTVPAFGYGPVRPSDRVSEIELECRPCSLHGPQVCPLGHHKCMRDQSVGSIISRLNFTLNR